MTWLKCSLWVWGGCWCLSAEAVIFGKDDRVSLGEASPSAQYWARSVPALVLKSVLETSKRLDSNLQSLIDQRGFCPDDRFAEEVRLANCTGSLIGPQWVLTSAHCFDENLYACANYQVVFDFHQPVRPGEASVWREDQVYECKNIIKSKFKMGGQDLALIELDRVVKNRPWIRVNPSPALPVGEALALMGYPLGISLKVVENGRIQPVSDEKIKSTEFTFWHDLDFFSVNSGSPIFNSRWEQVGVLVRGSGDNWTRDESSGCNRWATAAPNDFAEGNWLGNFLPDLQTPP